VGRDCNRRIDFGMVHFEQDKSYLWLLLVYCAVFPTAFLVSKMLVGVHDWGFVVLPLFVFYLMACQIRSGVALDGWWRATYPRGTSGYRALLVWESIVLVIAACMALIVVLS